MSQPKGRGILFGAIVVFIGALILGPKLLLTQPDVGPPAPTCEKRTVQPGQMLNSNFLMVNVYNASGKSGVANRVRINLERNGFLGGVIGNNEGALKPKNVMILTADPADPKVVLLAKQFKGKVEYAQADFKTEDGLSVLIGPKFKGVDPKGPTSLKVKVPVQVCVPTIELP